MMQLVHVLHEFEVAPDGQTLEQHYLSQGDGRISNDIDQEALKENKKLQSFVPTFLWYTSHTNGNVHRSGIMATDPILRRNQNF